MLLRRQIINLSCILNSRCPLRVCSYSSRTKKASQANEFNFVEDNKPRSEAASFGRGVFHQLSPLYRDNSDSLKDCRIELVDNETWNVSSGLAEAWKGNTNVASKKNPSFSKEDEIDDDDGDTDVDDIEDMRIRGNLFYKLDKDSKEYEEYTFDFHRRNKNKNNGNDNPEEKEKSSNISASGVEKTLKGIDEKRQRNNKIPGVVPQVGSGEDFLKRLRVPTFNQQTAPYHEPFCLDIFVSKGSVSASIIHRATSKVVAVAHSISKDMKFDLGSTKNNATCAAVGEVLAQRALADDIHNVVYTPRKGEKLEGKLNIILQSVINNGVNVKVKLKQRKTKKPGFHRPTA
ncbi:hypothetical protein RND71_020627 [Anisodus tanguticus]|uniref:Uncharacterized protein n=1 Tax=Anisodus tanguticus TaxID=243964 RepID=A0AAE1VIM6_9SOLA|nr:hypothetical protein RND71_020627 [Anisodus tanguticus]